MIYFRLGLAERRVVVPAPFPFGNRESAQDRHVRFVFSSLIEARLAAIPRRAASVTGSVARRAADTSQVVERINPRIVPICPNGLNRVAADAGQPHHLKRGWT